MKKNVFLILILASFVIKAFPQASNDAGLWTTLNIEKKINRNLLVFATEEYRLRENFTRNNLFYTDLGIAFKPYKILKISIAYRGIQKSLIDETWSFRHRLMLDISLKKKFGNFGLSYRHRIQSEVRNVNSSEDGKVPEWYSRHKFEVKYDLGKRITPYVSVEFRYQISNSRAIESDQTWHRSRYAAGFDYELDKRNTFGAYYLIQNEYNVAAPQNLYIIGLEYSLSL
ncbi:MAG: hypothetical protein JWP12_1799 [Bacteroidetes bacterium]|nr:hypothetical protein [Bacteroidota bacterium]